MLDQQEIQKYRALANKLTVYYITKLNSQMLTELPAQLFLMADQLAGFNPSFAVINKLRERITIVKPYEHKPYDFLLKQVMDLLIKRQHELVSRVGRYRFLDERMDKALAKSMKVNVMNVPEYEHAKIIKIEKQPEYGDVKLLLDKYSQEYEERKKGIDDESLIFKQDARREAFFSLGAERIWMLVDGLELGSWKEVLLVNEKKEQAVISATDFKFSSSFTQKPEEVPVLRFRKIEDERRQRESNILPPGEEF